MASYVRKVSLGDPVEICIRNQSFDDFVEELIPLRKEMATALKEAAAEPGLERVIRVQEDIKVIMNKILSLCMSP